MKKAFLLIALLLVSFWCINVKADDDTTLPIATDPEAAEIEVKKEEKVEEVKVEIKEEEKVPEVKAEAKAEPTRGDAKADDTTEPKTCYVVFNFKEVSKSGKSVRSGNSFTPKYTNTLSVGSSWQKFTPNLTITEFTSGNAKYTLDGWYEEDGSPIPPERYYGTNGSNKRIYTHYVKCTADSPDRIEYTYLLMWDEIIANKYTLVVRDLVSTSSGSWSNGEGHFGSLDHTFHEPEERTHYQFLYYKYENLKFKAEETYSHDITNQGVEDLTETFDAYWQPDVTLDLYDGDNKFIKSTSSFESVSIEYETERVGYKFLGWFDADGNKVDETTFYPNEAGTKPEPKQITLYAKYEEIKINVGVTKVWDDENNQDGIRPDSINVTLSNGTTVTLNEENKWTATVKDVPEYKDGEKINYTWTEDEVEGYELTDTSVEDNITTLTNTHIPEVLEIIVNKVWDDDDNESGKRPESVTVKLVSDEEEIETVELNEENKWTHTFKVPAYSNGNKIEYDIREAEVPEGYEVAYEGSIEDGITIHNVLGQGDGEPENPTNNPQTGDNIYLYLITLLISLSGLGICVKEYAYEK